jgi:hypothetical protein
VVAGIGTFEFTVQDGDQLGGAHASFTTSGRKETGLCGPGWQAAPRRRELTAMAAHVTHFPKKMHIPTAIAGVPVGRRRAAVPQMHPGR